MKVLYQVNVKHFMSDKYRIETVYVAEDTKKQRQEFVNEYQNKWAVSENNTDFVEGKSNQIEFNYLYGYYKQILIKVFTYEEHLEILKQEYLDNVTVMEKAFGK